MKGTIGIMRKVLVVACVAFVFSAIGCSSLAMPEKMPGDFNFVLRFGIDAGMGSKNVLDTFKGTFTKDLVMAGTATTKLQLTDREMQTIYKKMRAIKIWTYPEQFRPLSNMAQTPHSSYYFKIQYNGITKEIFWNDENVSQREDAIRLRQLIQDIEQIIRAKDEYKKLPEPTGGYV